MSSNNADNNTNKNNDNRDDNFTNNDENYDNTPLPFRRIKIMDLDWDITRAHVEELCSKFGKITNIEMIRTRNRGWISFVTFMTFVDAEFAVYQLQDRRVMGYPIRVYAAPVTEEEKEEKKKERKRKRKKKNRKRTTKKEQQKTTKKNH